jgi:CelD/BcsL family acetyltransferase involved in cellulose biosynthesis
VQNNSNHINITEPYKSNHITVRCISSVEEFSDLKQDWNELAAASDSTIYQTFEWSYLWWEHYSTKQKYDLHIILFYNDKQLVGIAPLFIYKKKLFDRNVYKYLRFLGTGTAFGISFGLFSDNGPSDYLDILLLPGFESNVAKSFWEYLNNQHNIYDVIEFVNLREDSKFINYFVPTINEYEFKYRKYKAECCPYIKKPDSIDDFFQALPASVRRRMVQTYKAAEEGKLYKIIRPESKEDIQKAYDELVQLHQERWNRIGYLGFFYDKKYSIFFANIFRAFLSKGWIWFKSAYSDNKCVASRLAFKYNDRYYDYLSAFDDLAPAAKRRPGLALLIDMLRDAISDNSQCLDLLRGDEQYKFELTASQNCNWNFVITNLHKRSKFISIFQKIFMLIKLFSFINKREKRLFKVQQMQHGSFSSIYYYGRFRFKNLVSKIKRMTSKHD